MAPPPDTTPAPDSATLLISCADRQGLVAAVTNFIAQHNGNILHLDQHVDAEQNIFFMRVVWDLTNFDLTHDAIDQAFRVIAERFTMSWELRFSTQVYRMAVFVSKQSHCLYDILSRWQSGEWTVEIPLIVSNHPNLKRVAHDFGIPYHVLPVNKDNKPEQEQKQIALLREHNIDFVVLARYMQILSADFVAQYPNRVINVHHSFLPAFPGAKPYHSAYNRGVKIIGATSHYVTAELDGGPIIEQNVVQVSHRESVADLIRKGKDNEKVVLAKAIWHHIQNQILVYNNKTVIFG